MAIEPTSDDVKIDTGEMLGALWRRKIRIVLVTVLLLGMTYVALMFVPKMYESSASLLVEPRDSSFLRATNDVAGPGGVADDSAISSQIELIQSRDSLLRVLEVANLRNEAEFTKVSQGLIGTILQLFGRPAVSSKSDNVILGNLESRLTVVRERDSQLISILFRSEAPQLAAHIANAVAQTHVNRRTGVLIDDTADATRWLEVEIDKLRARVSEAEAEAAAYRVDNDLFVGSNNTSLLDQQLSDISAQITQSQERRSTAQSRLTVLRSLIESGQSIEGIAAVQDSSAIQRLGEEKGRLQGERAQSLATLLPNHPEVLTLTSQILEINKAIVAEGQRVADSLDAEARIEAGVEQSLRDELVRLKIDVSGATRSTVTLNELEREAKAQRDLLETYLLRYRDASARTDSSSALPNIRIVSVAAPSFSPASPKSSFIMAAVLIVSLIGQFGQILFFELLSGRALVDSPRARYASDFSSKTQFGETEATGIAPVSAPMESGQQSERITPFQPAPMPQSMQVPSFLADSQPQVEPAHVPGVLEFPATTQPPSPHESAPFVAETAPGPAQVQSSFIRAAAPLLPPELQMLGESIAAAQERVVFVGTLGSEQESKIVAELIQDDALRRGISVAVVDGSSNKRTSQLGLTDLCAGSANFGDVVYRAKDEPIARVPWGRQGRLEHGSGLAVTLVEALSDIFELVIVSSGRPGIMSSLPAFAGVKGYLLFASPFNVDEATYLGLQADSAVSGFDRVQIIHVQDGAVQVA